MKEAEFWRQVIESKFFYRESKADDDNKAEDLIKDLFPKLLAKKERRKSTASTRVVITCSVQCFECKMAR